MPSISACSAELTTLIQQNKTLEAMDRFYADAVTMQENSEPPRVGKMACLEQERKNIAGVAQVTAHLISQAINEDTGSVFSEWRLDYTDLSGNRFSLDQVSVQQWQNEQIIRERFYYKSPTMAL